MEKQKKYRKYRGDKQDLSKENKIVYTTRAEGPEKLADWQLKLKAISACIAANGEIINDWVENKYRELIQK